MKHRLSRRIGLLAIFMAFVLAVAACAVSYRVYTKTITEHYNTMAQNLSDTLVTAVDKQEVTVLRDEVMGIYREICSEYGGQIPFDTFSDSDWETYYSRYQEVEALPEYQKLLAELQEYGRKNQTSSIYIGYTDIDTGYGVYLIDGSEEGEASPIGTADPVEPVTYAEILKGNYGFPPNITNYPEYGWLCSVGTGIYGADGSIIGTLCIDISMDDVKMDGYTFLGSLGILMLIAAVILLTLIIYTMNRMVVRPINRLAQAAASFVSERNEDNQESVIARAEVHTGDEIENLYDSMKKMELDINTYIHDLTAITAEKERISAELDVAKTIQASMLPCTFPAFPNRNEFDVFASMTPAKEVGGDFYDFFLIDPDHFAMVIADVSGKGVPAALFMVVSRTMIKNTALSGCSPAEILASVNNQLCENNEANMFVTVWIGILTISTGTIVCSNAGHEFPAIRRNGTYELIKDKHGLVLGVMEDMQYTEYEIKVEPGDQLFVYTDGVPEATNAQDELFGTDRMVVLLNQYTDETPDPLLHHVKAGIDDFVGDAPQFDDLTMLSLLYRGPQPQ